MIALVSVGSKFGMWTAVEAAELSGKPSWLCRCECGVERVVRQDRLRSGRSKSCGCLKVRLHRVLKTTHGMNRSPTHYSWLNMISRCRVESFPDFHNYGGRGITVCDRWQAPDGFVAFLADMGERPAGTTLDRFPDNDGNYEPGNCRWATKKEQSRNKRASKYITYAGETLPLVEWAKRTGIPRSRLHMRLYAHDWPVAQALGFEPR